MLSSVTQYERGQLEGTASALGTAWLQNERRSRPIIADSISDEQVSEMNAKEEESKGWPDRQVLGLWAGRRAGVGQ